MGKTNTAVRLTGLFLIVVLAASLLSGCGAEEPEPTPTPNPHEGQVYLYDGYDWTWMTLLEGVELNTFQAADFENQNGTPVYTGSSYTVQKGIDVSEHQLEIDWSQVATENLDFCYVRIGRRGYTEGGLFEDTYFNQNFRGAEGISLNVGVYFFSQAISVSEAIEEANFVLDCLQQGGYRTSLPIVFDWEKIEEEGARTADLPVDTLTDCAVAFCETIRSAGYTPCVYFNRTTGYYRYDLTRLTTYKVWFSLPYDPPDILFPSFLYRLDMWQYTISGTCAGISTETDFNYIFTPVPGAASAQTSIETSAAPSQETPAETTNPTEASDSVQMQSVIIMSSGS